MEGATHRLLGGLAGVVYTAAQGASLPTVILGGLVATATSNGPASPDGDQTRAWNRIDNLLPKRLAGHRGILHWWGLPAAAHVWLVPQLDVQAQWAATLLIIGWISHLAGDFVFGQGRRAGVPLWPGGGYVGLRLDTGGWLESGGRFLGFRIPSLTRTLLSLLLVLSLATTAVVN